ncbi:TPA: ead/Ea22-like family protein [Pseudomonas aeruginosa]|uniref:ead/Ea22-like family protein n=1 Tax=Pseudomonas aeruginosa TaxID=287 RepID=UPI00053EAB01|nr:ead/Ea22-like family protein [Pseudomonas aeruginosa]
MTDTKNLKELAERATPGPWSCNRHWAIVGGPILEFTNGAAQQQIAMACGQSWMRDDELRNNAEFIAAANPAAVLELIAEVERLRSRLEIDERIPHDGISCRDETIKGLDDECHKLKAENDALRKFSAEAYQVLGALDAPENVLDNASGAANGVPLRHETLLPFFAEDYEALRKDAARYRALRQKERGVVVVRNRTSHLFGEHLDAAIDAAIEGAKQ